MILEATIPSFLSVEDEKLKLTHWLFETIQPYLKGRTLEINSGDGTMAGLFAANALNIHLSEANQTNRQSLRAKFVGIEPIRSIHNIDFHQPAFTDLYASLYQAFKTIIALNITEYRYYDKLSLQNASRLLTRHGRLLVIMPSFTALYDGLDIPLAEWKKYNRQSIKQILTGFNLLKTINFNYSCNPGGERADSLGLFSLIVAQKID